VPELNWIVASSSYLDEFYLPLRTLRNITIIAIISSLFLIFPVIVRISSSITMPLEELMRKLDIGAAPGFSVRMEIQSQDELGRLAAYFNSFMERLREYSNSLKKRDP